MLLSFAQLIARVAFPGAPATICAISGFEKQSRGCFKKCSHEDTTSA